MNPLLKIKLAIITICLISLGLAVNGQDRETRKINGFVDIEVQGPFKVELTNGEPGEVLIYSGKIPMEEIVTEVRGKQLTIKLKTRAYLKEHYYDTELISIKLSNRELEEIDASIGSQVRVSGIVRQEYLSVESTMGAEVELEVDVEELYSKVSMGGIIEIKGKAHIAEVTASMGGEFNGHWLKTNRADLRAGMGGEIYIGADGRLTGSASMGGIIEYTGNPEKRNTSTILGGEINKSREVNQER